MGELRIILAEDHAVVRAGLRSLVDATPGMHVIAEAQTGEEAVDQARRLKPDIVLMDVSMPVLDGAAATERIVRDCPEVRVLALTAHEDRAHVARLLQAGAAGYLVKRAAVDELVRAIRAVAAGGTYVDPALAATLLRRPQRRDEPPEPRPTGDPLSGREEEVLRRIAWGQSNKAIAGALGISVKTVETYKARIGDKLGLRSRTDMVRYAVQQGWLADG